MPAKSAAQQALLCHHQKNPLKNSIPRNKGLAKLSQQTLHEKLCGDFNKGFAATYPEILRRRPEFRSRSNSAKPKRFYGAS